MDMLVTINSEDIAWMIDKLRNVATLSVEELARLERIAVEAGLEELMGEDEEDADNESSDH